MRIAKRVKAEIVDRFEAGFDYIPAMDKVPNYIKREAAEEAAKIAFEYIKERG